MKLFLRVMVGVLVIWSSLLHANIRIVISEGVDSARPIAVVPFKWSGEGTLPQDVTEIVTNDLRNSGKFNPLNTANMPQQPATAAEVNPSAWTGIGITSLVVGEVKPGNDGSFVINYQLLDLSGAAVKTIHQNQFKAPGKWLRYASHTVSDEVFEKLIGIKGAFRTRIAYIVKTDAAKFKHELRIADYDGYNQMMIHRSPEPLMSPAWSPDGSKIAYVTFETGRSELVLQTLATGQVQRIAAYPRHNGAPAFSPDGSKLTFVLSKDGSLNLYMMELATGQIRQLTSGRSNDTEPSWFPDNRSIAFTSDRAGRPQVYKLDILTGATQRLTWEGSQNQDADVSSDGKFMVMVSTINGKQNISKQDLDSGSVQVLTKTFLDETPSIAPNGTMIIYSASHGLGNVLQLVSTDGRFKASIPATDGQVKFPAWSPYL